MCELLQFIEVLPRSQIIGVCIIVFKGKKARNNNKYNIICLKNTLFKLLLV
jgi:hypothetical protein